MNNNLTESKPVKTLLKLMLDNKLNNKQLSEISHVYEEAIDQITSGHRPISVGEAKKIAKALHCSTQDLTNKY